MTARRVRAAVVIWVGCAVVVWNVIFERVLGVAVRQYIERAAAAAQAARPYERIDDWMPAARMRGFWTATWGAAAVLVVGLAVIAFAARRGRD